MNIQHVFDEGYNDEEVLVSSANQSSAAGATVTERSNGKNVEARSVQECEELAYQLLASLPRARLATIQRRLAPLLQFDVVGSLPAEVSLQIFSYLPFPALLTCGLVCRRWNSLANDQTLWKKLCDARGWKWRQPTSFPNFSGSDDSAHDSHIWNDSGDDEGMGDSDEETEEEEEGIADTLMSELEMAKAELTMMHAELDSGLASMSFSSLTTASTSTSVNTNAHASSSSSSSHTLTTSIRTSVYPHISKSGTVRPRAITRHSAPSQFGALGGGGTSSSFPKPDYKLLHQTYIKLQKRILTSSYTLSALQTRGAPPNAHTNTIYCLQLYTYPSTGVQSLFTGSRDKTVREWNLSTGLVERVISGIHLSSVLSICVANGVLASAGSDRRVVVWDLERNKVMKVIEDHEDSVLCVRFDEKRLVSCSKDRTVRTYLFPDLAPQFILGAHRAAVNAVSISDTLIVSGSGDRSIRLWDANTGKLLRTFENHHSRGIASIDFKPPYVLSGSSDKHLRLFDITTLRGWSTSPEYDTFPTFPPTFPPIAAYSATLSSSLSLSSTPSSTLVAGAPSSSTNPSANSSSNIANERDFADFAYLYPYTYHHNTHVAFGDQGQAAVCQTCGTSGLVPLPLPLGAGGGVGAGRAVGGVGVGGRGVGGSGYLHRDLVRSVAFGFGQEFVLSGSYDLSIKVWDRKTGALVADLSEGHTGRIFCIGFDCTKIVSCGEDQRICIWDFAHGIDTSFIQL